MAHEHEDLVVGRADLVAGEGDRSETASQDDAALLVSSSFVCACNIMLSYS